MADWIEMPFGVVSGVGPRNDVLDGGPYTLHGTGKSLGKMGRRNVTYDVLGERGIRM